MDAQHHNVILFGAGASADAGIPLLDSFVTKMWEYGIRGKVGDEPISDDDKKTLLAASQIREELEKYNSRAFFDSWNLEDILSLLSFESLNGGSQTERYDTMVKAVARTIELSCKYPYVQGTPKLPFSPTIYQVFWQTLLNAEFRDNYPALITFNYDLVLERTLWQSFHHFDQGRHKPPVKSCGLQYYLGTNDFVIEQVPHQYKIPMRTGGIDSRAGHKVNFMAGQKAEVEIPYLKLHGSLNWNQHQPGQPPPTPPTEGVEQPLILPPVFNKLNSRAVDSVWRKALDVLRLAKKIIIVGYSLPKTDIYMQYFLKSAVGPNSNLQSITVFDPALFRDDHRAQEMKNRYLECFSPQFSNRIIFRPAADIVPPQPLGTLQHFIQCLRIYPKTFFFYP